MKNNIITFCNFITCTNLIWNVQELNNELKHFFVQNFNDLKHIWINDVEKLYIIMIGMKVTESSWWILMGEIDKTSWGKNDNSFVNDGGILMNSMVLLDIFNNVYKCSFDMMARSTTIILFNVVTLNFKHWVFLQTMWVLDHWIFDPWNKVEKGKFLLEIFENLQFGYSGNNF